MAVMAPKVPTMKYEKTLLVVSPPVAMYFPKLGILVVGLASAPRNGLSNDEVCWYSPAVARCMTSALPRLCIAEAGARKAGDECRAHERSNVCVLVVRGAIAQGR